MSFSLDIVACPWLFLSTATTGYLNNNTVFSYYKRAAPTVTIYDNAGNSGKCTRSVFGGLESTNQNVSTDSGNEKSIHVFSNTGSNILASFSI